EMFYWTGAGKAPDLFDPKDKHWVEIWNDVFMAYDRKSAGKLELLKQKNVDTGMGMERTVAVLSGKKSAYETELFQPMIKVIEEIAGIKYTKKKKEIRIIADHLRAAAFVLGDENYVVPSNVDRGYILRRLVRRAIRYGKLIGIKDLFTAKIAELVIKEYGGGYPELKKNKSRIVAELQKEEEKFASTLEKGLKEFNKMAAENDLITGKDAFLLFQSYGFPLEMTQELALEQDLTVDEAVFKEEFEKHQALSRTAAAGKFKGGLSDNSPIVTRMHTATHLLNEALRRVIDPRIKQRGSNITPERLRFDFSFDRKLTSEEIQAVEDEVNRVIQSGLEVTREEMSKDEAMQLGAQMEFGAKYPDRVSVYFIGDYSKEFCGGPHVRNTNEMGRFKIIKEESSAAGVRRIKAVMGEE
ncbi:alanine--tRNA ligase, partial [Candidatus Woesearchaeota archaeon]|nr:alanine--tRNA ligase [Candidatus Woesearchaeota archaeon]